MGQNEVINPHALYAEQGIQLEPPVLTADLKAQLAQSGKSFSIVKLVDDLAGEFGRFLQLTAELDGYTFRFNVSDPSDVIDPTPGQQQAYAEYMAIKAATDRDQAVGPYRLVYIEWKGGNPFYKLEPATPPPALTDIAQEALPF